MELYKDLFARRKSLPQYWYNKASDLRGSAGVLWSAMNDPAQSSTAQKLGLPVGFSFHIACWPVYQMLCGMALELLLKAISVARGVKPRPIHDLNVLASDAGITFSEADKSLLDIYSSAIHWEGRYPVPKKEQRYYELAELEWKYLYDPTQTEGGVIVRRPNENLSWQSFNRLWDRVFDAYWKTANASLDTDAGGVGAG